MKNLAILVILAIVFSISVCGQEIMFDKHVEKNSVKITAEKFDSEIPSMRVKCELRSAEMEFVETPKGKFVRMLLPGFYSIRRHGEPQIPMINEIIEVPLKAKVRAEVISKQVIEMDADELGTKGIPIYPAQPSVCKQQKEFEFSYKEAAYKKGYSKSDIVFLKEIGTLRSYRLFMMQIKVCDYNPKDEKIRFITDAEIEITFEDADLEETKKFKKRYSSPPVDKVCTKILSSPSLVSMNSRKNALKYLIIADPMFRNTLQPFVDFKESKGCKSVVLYTDKIGKNKYDIRNAIEKEYKNPADGTSPTFLLFAGDEEHIAGWDGTEGSYKTDLPYVTMDGNGDYLPDMLHGRFSAQTVQEMAAIVEKTVDYEKGALAGYGFLKDTLLVAGWDSYWAKKRGYPHIGYEVKYYINENKNGYNKPKQFLSSGSQQNVSQIHDAINRGVGFFNYTAHGTETAFHDPSFELEDVHNLNNAGKYPLVIGNCCLTNAFDTKECFGEAWLRKKNGGAIGFIGGSSFTYWDEDLWWGVGCVQITSDIENGGTPDKSKTGTGAIDTGYAKLQNFCNGGVMLAGNLAVQEADSYLTKYYFEVYHIMGDPGLPAYWATPLSPPSQK